jgi:lipopolysaccharide transport system permease protein
MTILLYVSPVLYPLESLPHGLQPLMLANPITGLVDGFRAGVTGTDPYSWPLVWGSLAASFVIAVAGVWVFERTQANLIDVL